jgi:hypothetical protein
VYGDHNVYFDVFGNVALILDSKNDYLTMTEMYECMSVNPHVYDMIAECPHQKLIDLNVTIGNTIRNIFGLCHPNNRNVVYDSPYHHEKSPENVSFQVIKAIWYDTHFINYEESEQ